MPRARIYNEQGSEASYLGVHHFAALPRIGEQVAVWQNLELISGTVRMVTHHASPDDAPHSASGRSEHPEISIVIG